jgi:hypothetical protein
MNERVIIKRWQIIVLFGLSGFAIGNMLAKLTIAIGF